MEKQERVCKSFIVILPFMVIYYCTHFFLMSNIGSTKTTFSLLFNLPLMIMTLPWSIWLTSGVEILLKNKFSAKAIEEITTVTLFACLWLNVYFFVGFVYFGKLIKWGIATPTLLFFLFIMR